MPQINFAPVYKDRWFYDRWQYCVSFNLREAGALKVLDHAAIDVAITHRRKWYQDVSSRWTMTMTSVAATSMYKPFKAVKITKNTISKLHDFAGTLIDTTDEFKLVTGRHQVWVYTNSVNLIETIQSQHQLVNMKFTQSIINRPKDTVRLKQSRHSHRSYLNSVKLTDTEKENLIRFLLAQQDDVRLSPGLLDWIYRLFNSYTYDNFFIDHTGEHHLLMMSLIRPGIIRKTLPIVTA
jgi:hypothetical protein